MYDETVGGRERGCKLFVNLATYSVLNWNAIDQIIIILGCRLINAR